MLNMDVSNSDEPFQDSIEVASQQVFVFRKKIFNTQAGIPRLIIAVKILRRWQHTTSIAVHIAI